MNIPDEIKEKIDKRAKGVGMLPIRMRVEDIEFGYGLASEEITRLQKREKDLVEQQIILIKERREMEAEIERTTNLIKKSFQEGYARRNSNYFSRDWEEFKNEHKL